MTALPLSKRSLLKRGVALALLPRVAAIAEPDVVSRYLPGIDVLTPDGRSMTVGELYTLPGLDPAVRRFLLGQLTVRDGGSQRMRGTDDGR